jgi:two-component system nitrate/nitrite response regulator NarL
MRLVICDDHKQLVHALSLALTLHGQTVVATAYSPEDAVAAAGEHQPDVCLLDVSFPHDNGLSAIAGILAVSPDTKVVMLSGSISKDLVADAIAQGAHGFISKENPIRVIVEALEKANQGDLAIDPVFMPERLQGVLRDQLAFTCPDGSRRPVLRCRPAGRSASV